ncbi:hypothetical protein TIFTF001_039130 [Ficus carica]|uniref:PGG domain-containing protein n=1 Tax=Ficus carica TaxID=3494 RepID=A0AA88JDT5_FICCA|nr:hypothetical protein TIFTF001_039126 [Ficus carica]GMN70086.1 hypothetical protein TIFTF001_039130 [Ficus carica]
MAKSVMPNAIVLEVLNKHNYVDWSEIVQSYLEAKGFWDVVKPSNPDDHDHDEAWRKKNAAALHAIKISCGPDTLPVIRGIRSARTAWDILEAKFKPQLPVIVKSLYRTGGDQEKNANNGHDKQYEPFFEALKKNEWKTIKELYTDNPNLLKATLPFGNIPVLHHFLLMTKAMHNVEDMLVEMLQTGPTEALEMKNFRGATSLAVASALGIIRFAECIVQRRGDLVGIPNDLEWIPVVVALGFGRNHMARYLYSVTPLRVLSTDHDGKHGATLITKSIEVRNLDIAIDLLRRHPDLTFAKDIYGRSPVYAVACAPSLFYSGHELRFWRRWIYNTPQGDDIYINIPNQNDGQATGKNILWSVLMGFLRALASLVPKLLGIQHLQEMKLVHVRATELLFRMHKAIETADVNKMKDGLVYDALFEAVDRGNFDFIIKLSGVKIELQQGFDDKSRNIFMRAIQSRQAEIFSLIYLEGDEIKLSTSVMEDKFKNNLLHIAGMLAPPRVLNRISGATLQMQRELQWFKEVEKVVPSSALTSENFEDMTPRDYFTMNHKDLVIAGEKWMKGTATSCTVVGALIVTIMFAVAFQVPGGNNQDTGYPIFVNKKLFKVFIVSDAISLFSSTTSVLTFLGILTSRYSEEDFLTSLPTKMIVGLSTLFFSIATMIISFCAVIFIMFRSASWILIPVVLLAVIPIALFAWMQFPLLVEIFMSTYGPSIFNRKIGIKLKSLVDEMLYLEKLEKQRPA